MFNINKLNKIVTILNSIEELNLKEVKEILWWTKYPFIKTIDIESESEYNDEGAYYNYITEVYIYIDETKIPSFTYFLYDLTILNELLKSKNSELYNVVKEILQTRDLSKEELFKRLEEKETTVNNLQIIHNLVLNEYVTDDGKIVIRKSDIDEYIDLDSDNTFIDSLDVFGRDNRTIEHPTEKNRHPLNENIDKFFKLLSSLDLTESQY